MAAGELTCRVRGLRKAAGLSQRALADEVGVSRQAIVAIESAKQVPSTTLALKLARALGAGVEELFALADSGEVEAVAAESIEAGCRLRLGRVDGRWVAHPLRDASGPSDGIARRVTSERVGVELLAHLDRIESNVLVAGCAPLLGNLAGRVGQRFSDAHGTWLGVGSGRALELLDAGLVHVAGLHLGGESAADHGAIAQARIGGQAVVVVNLAFWRQGLVFAPGNPRGIAGVEDLLREDVQVATREPGSGAARLLASALGNTVSGRLALGHADVARMVQWGIADVGVAIESVAVEYGLGFMPLREERFDLIVPRRHLDLAPVSRLLDGLHDAGFRRDAAHLVGYDLSSLGDTTTVGVG